MLIALSLFGLSVVSAGLIISELWKAPEAYEDEAGFHVVDKPQRISRPRASKPRAPAVYEEEAVINA
jgi:hypothetical protein